MAEDEYSDRELIRMVLEVDRAVFKTIIINTQGLVIQIIYKMIKNHEDRKDLIQDVYLKVYNKLSSFNYNAKLSTWIGTIAYNTCLNFLEKKRLPQLDGNDQEESNSLEASANKGFLKHSDSSTERDLLKEERAQILAHEIEKLSPIFRTVVTLYHKQELSLKEIGEITSLPVGTVKSYLFRARKQLRENILLNYNKEDL